MEVHRTTNNDWEEWEHGCKDWGNEVNHGYTCLGVVCMAVADLLLATQKSRMHHFFPPSFFITLSNSLNAWEMSCDMAE